MRWERVTRKHPCEICDAPDWCGFTDGAAICMRVESDKPTRNGGWLHVKDTSPTYVSPRPVKPAIEEPTLDAEAMWRELRELTDHHDIDGLAMTLGIDADALRAVGCVRAARNGAFGFPMKDETEKIIGIRLRGKDGSKWAAKGSRNGLFIPDFKPQSTLYIVEGPTDTAAALTIGLFALGRPSALVGAEMVNAYCRLHRIKRVVVIADNDQPDSRGVRVGLRGAERLQATLSVSSVRWLPPTKDLREFVRCGGDASDIENALKDLVWQTPSLRERAA